MRPFFAALRLIPCLVVLALLGPASASANPVSLYADAPTSISSTSVAFNGHLTCASGDFCDSWFHYRLHGTSSWTSNTTSVRHDGTGAQINFSDTATGLTPSTSYDYQACGNDPAGNECAGPDGTFSTIETFSTIAGPASGTTLPPTSITTSSAYLGYSGTCPASATCYAKYQYQRAGLTTWVTTGVAQTLACGASPCALGPASWKIAGLAASTTYDYQVGLSTDGTTYTFVGPDGTGATTQSFTTAAVTTGGPVCSPSPCTAGSLVAKTLTTQPDDGGGKIETGRGYYVYVPTNLVTNDPAHPVPLVALWGSGGGATDFESIAQTDKFILLDLADGSPSFGAYWIKGGLPSVTKDSTCGPAANLECDDNPAAVEALREVEAAYAIDPSQVFSVGASKGGGFTDYTACNPASSNLFTAFSAMSTAISDWGTSSASPWGCNALGQHGSWVPGSWTSSTCGTWNGTTSSPASANFAIQWVIGSSDGAVLPQGGLNGKGCWQYTVNQNATNEFNGPLGCSNTPTASTLGDGSVGVSTYTGCAFPSDATQAVIFPCNCHAYGIDGNNGIANVATVQWNFVSTEHRTSTPPPAPTGLTATYSSPNVNVAWSPATGATSYNVYRNGTLVGTTTGTSFSDTGAVDGLFSGTTYTYYLVALNSSYAASAFSAAASVSVP